jgi:hypothetical protein
MPDRERIPEVFMAIAEHCRRQGWVPVGQRVFTVGRFTVRVNGTKEVWVTGEDGVSVNPFSAVVDDSSDEWSVLVVDPRGGAVAGNPQMEAEVLDALRRRDA